MTLYATWAASSASKISKPIIIKSDVLSMSAADFAAKVASLDKAIKRLDVSFDRIELWLFGFTVLVAIGLIVEYWDDIWKLRALARRKRSGLDWPHHSESFGASFRAVFGGILVTIGVIGELGEEIQGYRVGNKSRDKNAQIVGLLTDEAKAAEGKIANDDKIAQTAASDAATLKINVGNLHDFVKHQIDQNKAALAELQRNTADLKKARTDALSAAAEATTDLAQVTVLLKQEQAMHQRILELAQPRTLTPEQQRQITDQLKPFAGQKYELSVSAGSDTLAFVCTLDSVLHSAGWVKVEPKTFLKVTDLWRECRIELDCWGRDSNKARLIPRNTKTFVCSFCAVNR